METQIDVTGASDSGTSTVVESSTTTQSSGASSLEQSPATSSAPVQGTTEQSTQAQDDPFAGIQSVEELTALAAQNVPHAKGELQLRKALEARNTAYTDLEGRFKPLENFVPHLERFEKPEDLQQIVDFREKLYGWTNDPTTGQLVPGTAALVQELTATAPDRADFLSADLLNGMTKDPDTGRTLSRMDLALEAIAENPERRAKALQILGAVDQTSIAPTWQPTAEELERIPEELQDIYKKLPYDKRQSLNVSDPEVVKDYLEDQKFKADVRERDARQQASDQQVAQQREQYIQREAENAGNELVKTQFQEGFQGFAKKQCEVQYIKPLDPQSPEAQAMGPEQAAATNEKIQKINRGAGLFVSTVVVALSHPETSFLAREFAREIGITDDMLQKLDAARVESASNNRNFGNLQFRSRIGQNGNGNGELPQDIGMIQGAAQRSGRSLIAHGSAVAGPIRAMLSELFALQATHNSTLNGTTARPAISGTGYDPTQVGQRPVPKNEDEIRAQNRAAIQRLAGT